MSRDELAASAIGAEATGPVPGWGWTEASLLFMVLVWGVNYSVVKAALAELDPLAFNAIRFCIASAFVYLVLRAQGALGLPERRDALRIVALGVVGNVIYQGLFIVGLDHEQAGATSLLLAISPVLTAFLSAVTGHERPGARTWAGAAVAVAGIALVTGGGSRSAGGGNTLAGDAILISAAAAWSAYTVGSRPMVRKYGSVRTTAWTMWVGAVGLTLIGAPAIARQRWAAVDWRGWGGLFFSAFFAIGLAYLIWYRGVEKIGNTRTAVFSNLNPVVAMISAAILLHERPSPAAIAGAALILAGIMIVRSDPVHAAASGR